MFITTILVGSVLRLSLPLPPCDTKNHSIIFDINNSSPSRNRKALTCKHFDGAALVRLILIPLFAIWYTDWSNSLCVLLAAGFAIGLLPSCSVASSTSTSTMASRKHPIDNDHDNHFAHFPFFLGDAIFPRSLLSGPLMCNECIHHWSPHLPLTLTLSMLSPWTCWTHANVFLILTGMSIITL